jgi:hypothetical protein
VNSRPLVVDLDGTLVLTDSLHESAVRAVRCNFFDVLQIPFWFKQGKAVLKEKLALCMTISAGTYFNNKIVSNCL